VRRDLDLDLGGEALDARPLGDLGEIVVHVLDDDGALADG
jgi:hypothetical protein